MGRTGHPSLYDYPFQLMGGSTFYRENFDAGDQSTDVAAALTTTAPATIATPTTVVNRPWVAVS